MKIMRYNVHIKAASKYTRHICDHWKRMPSGVFHRCCKQGMKPVSLSADSPCTAEDRLPLKWQLHIQRTQAETAAAWPHCEPPKVLYKRKPTASLQRLYYLFGKFRTLDLYSACNLTGQVIGDIFLNNSGLQCLMYQILCLCPAQIFQHHGT